MITINRGNSAAYAVIPKINGSEYTLVSGDKVLFCVKTSDAEEAETVLEKTLTSSDYNASDQLVLTLNPSDTIDLCAGTYKCDFALQFANGSFYTFIKSSDFILEKALCEAVSE